MERTVADSESSAPSRKDVKPSVKRLGWNSDIELLNTTVPSHQAQTEV